MISLLLISLGITCLLVVLIPWMGQRAAAPRTPSRACCSKNSSGMIPLLVVILGGAAAFGLWNRARFPSPKPMIPPAQARTIPQGKPDAFPPLRRSLPPTIPSAKPVTDQPPSWTVVGTGVTREEAEQDALDRGQSEVITYLRTLSPPVEWTPPLDYLGKYLVKERQELPPKMVEPCDLFPTGQVPQFSLRVEMTPETQADIDRLDRQAHMEQRLPWLARILVGLVALLVAVTGYVRLDEWSKGYYTGLLRLAAFALVGASGLGLWLLR